MKCIRPTQFSNAKGYYIACGQCMPCRITRRTEWTTKLLLEWKTFTSGAFVTLTYDQDHLPDKQFFKGGSLNKDDLQKFLKRFRFNYQEKYGKTKIRHFAVGEYGDKSSRAHYHILLFNVDPGFTDDIVKKSWTLGITQTDELHKNRIKYTVGYTIKKLTSLENFPDGRVPEFSMASKNPALGWYSIPILADKLRKYGLFPSRSMQNEDLYILEQDGYNFKSWNGIFYFDKDGRLEFPVSDSYKPSPGASYARLDNAMMVKLGKYMSPHLEDYLDARRELLIPKRFRSRTDLLSSKSYVGKINFVGSEEYIETVKKSEKINRRKSDTKKI